MKTFYHKEITMSQDMRYFPHHIRWNIMKILMEMMTVFMEKILMSSKQWSSIMSLMNEIICEKYRKVSEIFELW